MLSQIPAAAAQYFASVGVDVSKHHPVVHAWFRPGKGWTPCINGVPVSHTYLVRIRDTHGVTEVCLKAPNPGGYDNLPDYSLKHLLGNMGQLDAEFTDGVPCSEGSGMVGTVEQVAEVLAAIGVGAALAQGYLVRAATEGECVFIVEERDNFTGYQIEGWRYRLTPHGKDGDDRFTYELSVLAHDPRREA
jgi:hypothetical protein